MKNLLEIVKDIGNVRQVETDPSSPLFKAATKIYNLVKKKRNVNSGLEKFLEVEKETLTEYEVTVEEKEGEEKEEEEKEAKEKVERGRRKSFNNLKSSTSKKARVDNVITMLKSDPGLEDVVVEKLKMEKEQSIVTPGMGESFKLA